MVASSREPSWAKPNSVAVLQRNHEDSAMDFTEYQNLITAMVGKTGLELNSPDEANGWEIYSERNWDGILHRLLECHENPDHTGRVIIEEMMKVRFAHFTLIRLIAMVRRQQLLLHSIMEDFPKVRKKCEATGEERVMRGVRQSETSKSSPRSLSDLGSELQFFLSGG